MAATDDNAGTGVPPTADTPAPAAPKKRASRAAKPDPEALAAEIEKTREDLADTLDAIAEKVSPKRVAKRTTKKVTSAVKDTAHDAASAVKDTASSAKEKVSGGRSEQSWAPPAPKARPAAAPVEDLSPQDATHPLPLPLPSTEAAPVPADIVTAPAVSSTPEPAKPWYAPPAAAVPPPASGGSLVRPEYIAVGAAAALVAWFLVCRRR